mgnify:CR=1 FL=1
MFDLDTPVITVIEHGKQLLKNVGYVPQRYKCVKANEAIAEVQATDPNMTVGSFADAAVYREDWAILCAFCLIVREFETQLSKALQIKFLMCCSKHTETVNVLNALYSDIDRLQGETFSEIRQKADPQETSKLIKTREILQRRREFKWQ